MYTRCHDPMSTHERTKCCGRHMLKQNTGETVLVVYIQKITYLYSGVNSPVGVLNVVGIQEPLHE